MRDQLLGHPVNERDWVVVGGSPAELERLGYRRVGRSFPVFLHPESGEEYALARTETKSAPGYRGFDVRADSTVTLEEDLRRRDLTINAMAQDESGRIIDPWGGRADLRDRVLRHVSDAFREDPVRILRAARFAARYRPLGFRIADETLALMAAMVAGGEASALVAERVWQETELALAEPRPDVFIEVLRDCGALAVVFPEVDALFGVPQPERWHPEVDTGVHLLMALRESARRNFATLVRFAVLTHDLGKGTTRKTELPRHVGHEQRSQRLAAELSRRLGVPTRYRELAELVARHHGIVHRALELRPGTILRLLEAADAFRRPDRFALFLDACEADARGRKGRADRPYPQRTLLTECLRASLAVETRTIVAVSGSGPAAGEAIRRARTGAIRTVIARFVVPDPRVT